MTTQFIFDSGGFILIEIPDKSLLIRKEQIRTIDKINETTVRLDMGEGPLRNIYIQHPFANTPMGQTADEILEVLEALMLSGQNSTGTASEGTLVALLQKVISIDSVVQQLKLKDTTQTEPTCIDESNQNMIYKGWHSAIGSFGAYEWAIERITRQNEIVVSEWAEGNKLFTHSWDERATLGYLRYKYINIAEGGPLP
jgi:hypothetical protein